MKITDVTTILLTGPCTNDPFLSECRGLRSAAFIRIHTDSAPTGLGETYAGYFCPEVVPGIVEFFAPILIGQTVDDIPRLWARMYHCGNYWCRTGLGAAVLSGIEAALWDLRGKAEGVPVHELLGGCRHERLLGYATGGPSNYPPDKLLAKIDFYLDLGFQAVKLGVGSYADGVSHTPNSPSEAADLEASKLAIVRAEVGGEVEVMLDGHMGNHPDTTWDLVTAKAVMEAVKPFDLFFFEEPLHYTDPWGYAELCRSTPVPIAGGECLTATCEWRVFAEQDAFDIGQPDAAFTGGLMEFVKVAEMLDKRGRKVATHAWGAGGALMQNLHCGFACSNTVILEIPPAYAGLHADIIGDGFAMQDGMVLPPRDPGLGITLTDEIASRYPFIPGSGEFNSVPGKILTT